MNIKATKELLVMTDLNGTLLNEQGSAVAAMPAISRLIQANIPLILNSSKPACDLRALQQKLNIHTPFICENGAALWTPADSGSEDFICQDFGMPKQNILHVLAAINENQQFSYLAFSAMNELQLPKLTQLDFPVLSVLTKRIYTESLLWQDTDSALERFAEYLQDYNLCCRRQGDVVQVCRQVHKALPIPALKEWYEQRGKVGLHILALGDGQHDLPMLEQADEACFFGEHPAFVSAAQQHISSVACKGPACWNQLVLDWLELADGT